MKTFKMSHRVIIIAVMVFIMACTVHAKMGIIYRNSEGDVFCTQTGWVKAGKDLYYVHKTNGMAYKRGEACRNDYRWKGNKLYYFGDDGRALRRSVGCVKLRKDGSVRYILVPGIGWRQRYNVRHRSYQVFTGGAWHDVGMRTNVPWMCDWQK